MPFSWQLFFLTLSRWFINCGIRLIYPFLPALSRGMGIPLTELAGLVSIRGFVGFASPLFGPLSDSWGRRPVMMVAVLLFAAAALLMVFAPGPVSFALALAGMALSKYIFDPALMGYLGDTVPYTRRGRAIAWTELSWGGALLLGGPLFGLVLQAQGWRMPFLWLAVGAAALAAILWKALPLPGSHRHPWRGLGPFLGQVRGSRGMLAAMLFIFLLVLGNELLMIVYGNWMEVSFALSLTSLGLASSVIGVGEVLGELTAGWAADHFGKRRTVIVASLACAGAYLLIALPSSLFAALAAMFILFLFFEIATVSAFPLFTEILPGARAMSLSLVGAAASLARALGDLTGPVLNAWGGILANSLTAAILMVLAVGALAWGVRERT
jgi:DHA1 family inner membrane transport protein